jgi:hypothetical protein
LHSGTRAERDRAPAARIATLVAFFVIAAIALFADIDRTRAGTPSVTLVPDHAANSSEYLVTAAPPGSPLHRGDRVAIDDPQELARTEYVDHAIGSVLRVRRTAPPPVATIDVPIVASAVPRFWPAFLFGEALFIGIAMLIAARGRANGSLSLAWLFALVVLLVNPTTPAWPGWLVLSDAIVSFSFATLTFYVATNFASRFAGDPNAQWARRVRLVAACLAALSVVCNATESYRTFFTATNPDAIQYAAGAALLAQVACFLVALVLASIKAVPAERQRVAWVAISLAAGICGFVGAIVAESVNIPPPVRYVPLLFLLAMPIGCAYAILRYRLLDIAFVVNRATVFGVTSLLVLAALALVDFGLEKLLGSWLLGEGIYVQLGLALVIGISTRPLHDRVDRVVDDLFFRQRHEAERSLRQFAREVAYIDNAGVVVERTAETVAAAAALQCRVLLATADESYLEAKPAHGTNGTDGVAAAIDRNDGAIVRLLANREAVDLHDVTTSMLGDYAFPMFVRNRLLGVLVCGEKKDGVAAYAPDELDAIGAVAHAAGLALDLLRIGALEREVAGLRGGAPLTQYSTGG